MNLKEKTGLVLGASRGIGRAIARNLAREGAYLALPWFDWPESSEAMKTEFCFEQSPHLAIEADLRHPDQVERLIKAIHRQYGRLDFVINNIERGGMPVVHGAYHKEVNCNQWQLEMDTTLHAKWQVFNQSLPLLKKSGKGAVINISSIAAITGRSGPAGNLFNDGYAAANKGVASLTENWARIGAPNIRVNEIMLGFIDSRHGPGTRGWELLSEKERRDILDHTLLARTGTPEEVACAVHFLLTEGEFITGSTIRVDGGYLLGGDQVPPMPPGIL